ncbi:MAG: tRNA (adenosine(37)-N6)-threonylcarbamoyltransferase complex transferase subunit TsaD [Fibromonadaceae bacterium]|jgi:N6-L-threonylcarbamoyladenine synthase|nr:tRNA (adenosine(37)-N6)-threonylcarbamoyltransferase complex transferase subunit TsaD [Fibromonadaceae bacterium]
MKNKSLWLGIESSCDDTACAVLQDCGDSIKILSNSLYSQIDEHKAWGGVVPELASRAHLEKIIPVLKQALAEAKISIEEIGQIAFTRAPGLMGSLLVGASFAQGLAKDLGTEAYGINHLEGHIYSAMLPEHSLLCSGAKGVEGIALIVSGGHTELLLVKKSFEYACIGKTRDDAAGEAFDKSGKILGLGYPAGAEISRLAKNGDRNFYEFPRALNEAASFEFSFSGFKTAVSRYVQAKGKDFVEEHIADICASLQEAIADILSLKAVNAAKKTGMNHVLLCGGVSANGRLRELLSERCKEAGMNFIFPELELCTDNGAMIAAAAIFRERAGMLFAGGQVRAWEPLGG